MEGIIIGTLTLWGVTALLVVPLTNLSLARSMASAGVDASAELPEEQKTYWEQVAGRHFVLWHIVVLAMAGLVGGLLGYFFIGFATSTKGWPGMIAFIAMSFLGCAASGGHSFGSF